MAIDYSSITGEMHVLCTQGQTCVSYHKRLGDGAMCGVSRLGEIMDKAHLKFRRQLVTEELCSISRLRS